MFKYHIAVASFLLDLYHFIFFFFDFSALPSKLDLLDESPSLVYHFVFFSSWSLESILNVSSDVLEEEFLDLLVNTRLKAWLISHDDKDFLIGCWKSDPRDVRSASPRLFTLLAIGWSGSTMSSTVICEMLPASDSFVWFLRKDFVLISSI